MDSVMRQMILSHDRWITVLQVIYGPRVGSMLYLATGRFMRLPWSCDCDD